MWCFFDSSKCEWIRKELIAYTSVVMVLNNSITHLHRLNDWLFTRLIDFLIRQMFSVGMWGMWSALSICITSIELWVASKRETNRSHSVLCIWLATAATKNSMTRGNAVSSSSGKNAVITWKVKPLLTTQDQAWSKIVNLRCYDASNAQALSMTWWLWCS